MATTKKSVKKVSKQRTPKKQPLLLAAQPAKKLPGKPKKTTKITVRSKPRTAKKKPSSARPKPKQFVIPLSRQTKVVLTFKLKKSKAKKRPAKKSKRSNRQELLITGALLLTGLFGSVVFGYKAIASPSIAPPKPQTQVISKVKQPEEAKSLPRSLPLRLRASGISLDTELSAVGLLSDGTVDVPSAYTKAGWYNASPTPGQLGPSVIVGHLDNVKGAAVFWRLHELQPGQFVEVDRQDGSTAKFLINQVTQFPQEAFPTKEIYGNTKQATLRLITCGGSFSRITNQYDQNTVVFATLVP